MGNTHILSINNLITSPKYPKPSSVYIFDITAYDIDGTTILESWTNYINIVGNDLTTSNTYLIGSDAA